MRIKITYCTPEWFENKGPRFIRRDDCVKESGYWSIKVIIEKIPRWYEICFFGKSHKSEEHVYTQICEKSKEEHSEDNFFDEDGDYVDNMRVGVGLSRCINKHLLLEKRQKIINTILESGK